ncbi:hypothetical protein MHSWG343_08550 [Candidatus Mycoplasma haematohominis]|uniref:Lipoprotein n=1 Tax=Candidatus Mycoplasma haematohominis TaxID=1494318 RepID=A0A478FQL0_9MOLU|nr:hypothetical protein MHSWG343_08550 [Candidatus Mycoplasma haemohominis]
MNNSKVLKVGLGVFGAGGGCAAAMTCSPLKKIMGSHEDIFYLTEQESKPGTIGELYKYQLVSTISDKNKNWWRKSSADFYKSTGQEAENSLFQYIYSGIHKYSKNVYNFKTVCRIGYHQDISQLNEWKNDLLKYCSWTSSFEQPTT